MIVEQNQMQRTVYYEMSTNNKSFLDCYYYLKSKGIKNCRFHLLLLDKDLVGIDPFDPRLNLRMKQKVLVECQRNYWYFIRNVVRIPSSGGPPDRYRMNRGMLAMNFCLQLNLNIYLELPRQQGKTMGAVIWYLWLYNFASRDSMIVFLNKKMETAKENLQRLKSIRDLLPSYLQMTEPFDIMGKRIKITDNVESMKHPINRNTIKVLPSARNKIAASNLLRGKTIPMLWGDEWAFVPFNDIIWINGAPAMRTAMDNARRNHAPYGALLSSTPGYLTQPEGIEAYDTIKSSTPFNEAWYDFTYDQLTSLLAANTNSSFVYIRYTYQQLGLSEAWFKAQCIDMKMKWPDIRREVLLEWAAGVENSPFTKEQLDIVQQLVKQPIRQIYLLGRYLFNIYDQIDFRNPPIIGVDVSGGYNRDSSALSVIDSATTKLMADFNCNYISIVDLTKVIYELVTKYMPNAVVNIERNGGFGASVIAKLKVSKIKKNLYYEIKDKVVEERIEGSRIARKTQRVKVYGLDNTKSTREELMEILRERMEYHKDKFVSPQIYHELTTLEVKRNGRIEHSSTEHDDSIFSLLMALYVYYNGKNLKENWGINKRTLKSDENLDEEVFGLEEKYTDILEEIDLLDNPDVKEQLDILNNARGQLFNEFVQQQMQEDQAAMDAILATKLGRQAYAKKFHTPLENLETAMFTIPDVVFTSFYDDDSP
ncbi:MAG: hypothetical protein J6Y02_10120 [Pseudobutyrivibrio sp.]|nr:hypothetical protein [Pseudobutyrivibrio sp.]